MSTPSVFPLLKLPILGIEEILLNANVFDLINFSLTSKKSQKIVKALKFPLFGFNIHVYKKCTAIEIRQSRQVSSGYWFTNMNDVGKDEPITRLIGKCQMKTCIKNDNFCSYSADSNLQQCVKSVIQYLMGLFKCPIIDVRIHLDGIPMSRRPLLIGFNKCEKLGIFGKNTIRINELREIIERITIRIRFNLAIPTHSNFRCDLVHFKPETIDFHEAPWVTSQIFHQLNQLPTIRNIIFRNCYLQATDLERVVRDWFNSDDTQKNFLYMSGNFQFENINFNDLNPMPWCEKRRGQYYVYNNDQKIKVSIGFDIERSDGLLATIVCQPSKLIFCVWHERFPDVTGLK